MVEAEPTVYLDHHATTPCDPRVVEVMLPYLSTWFANPSSQTHHAGRQVANAVGEAREQVASLIGAAPGEITFTGSATESNNLAILGLANATSGARRKIITTTIEHKSVLDPIDQLGDKGFDCLRLPVNRRGQLDLARLRAELDETVLLVSVQAANNEVGTIQDIATIADIAHQRGALVHCDAVQAVGRIPVDVAVGNVDLLSMSAHKLYGPKGVAALYIRGGRRTLPIQPLMFGGGQEDGLRPGTLNVPAIVGFGEASRLCRQELSLESERIRSLRDRLETELRATLPDVQVNGNLAARLPGNSSLTFSGTDAEAIIANLPTIALSAGSACTSGALEPSYVLTALGMSREEAYQTLRIGLGRFSNEDDVTTVIAAIRTVVLRITRLGSDVLARSNIL